MVYALHAVTIAFPLVWPLAWMSCLLLSGHGPQLTRAHRRFLLKTNLGGALLFPMCFLVATMLRVHVMSMLRVAAMLYVAYLASGAWLLYKGRAPKS